jgi:hypothetical protein
MITIVLSDIHLGNGAGYDIFAGEAVLPSVLAAAASQRARVILNGDTFDFLMNEDPLELDERRAVAQAEALVANPSTAAVIAGLGRCSRPAAASRSGSATTTPRSPCPPCRRCCAAASQQPPARSRRASCSPAATPLGATSTSAAPGSSSRPRRAQRPVEPLDYKNLRPPSAPAAFRYPPGSNLVKTLLNPLKRGSACASPTCSSPTSRAPCSPSLAVDPTALRLIFKGSTARLLWHLMRRLDEAPSFDDGEDPVETARARPRHRRRDRPGRPHRRRARRR